MKKHTVTIFLALSLCMPSQAQLRLGLRGGTSCIDNDITAIDTETVTSCDSYTGFFLGPMMELDLFGLGIDIAALYSQKGIQIDGNRTFKQNYIDIPVNLKLYFGGGSRISPFLEAGPQFSFLLSDIEKMYADAMESNSLLYQIRSFSLEDSSWSINVGGGIRFFDRIHLTVSYNMPVTHQGVYAFYDELQETQAMDIVDKASAYESIAERGNSKFKSSTMRFSVSYTF